MNKKQIFVRRAVAAGGACLTGLMLTACQAASAGTGSAGAQPPATSSQGNLIGAPLPLPAGPSAGATGSANSGSNANSTGGASSTVTPASPQKPAAPNGITACQDDQVQMTLGASDSGVGNFDIALIFKNTSAESCTLTGYAGAAVDYHDGSILNAQRHMSAYMGGDIADTTPQAVLLAPGSEASDLLSWNPGPTSVECLGNGTGTANLVVTAPGTSNSEALEHNVGGSCANFGITPVVPGTSGEKTS